MRARTIVALFYIRWKGGGSGEGGWGGGGGGSGKFLSVDGTPFSVSLHSLTFSAFRFPASMQTGHWNCGRPSRWREKGDLLARWVEEGVGEKNEKNV